MAITLKVEIHLVTSELWTCIEVKSVPKVNYGSNIQEKTCIEVKSVPKVNYGSNIQEKTCIEVKSVPLSNY
jgi:starvation-inducible outer membrane lipoprotein